MSDNIFKQLYVTAEYADKLFCPKPSQPLPNFQGGWTRWHEDVLSYLKHWNCNVEIFVMLTILVTFQINKKLFVVVFELRDGY